MVIVWLVVDMLRLIPACGVEFMSRTLDMTSDEEDTALAWPGWWKYPGLSQPGR